MIVRRRPGLLQLFLIWRGSIVPHILPELAVTVAFASAVTALALLRPGWLPDLPTVLFALLGLAFSVFLGFRNNACYDRWWEARRQWGQLIVELRSLARDSAVLDDDQRRRVVRRGIAFAQVLAARLRDRDHLTAAAPFIDPDEHAALAASRNPADFLLRRQGEELVRAWRSGRLGDIVYRGLADRLTGLAGVQAASERIRHTPLPFAYTLLLHRTAHLFCFLLPLGLAHTAGWATPLLTMVVAYTFFGLDALGDQLEEPFGTLENDLPVDALVRTVEIDLRESLGETGLPPALEPRGFVLN